MTNPISSGKHSRYDGLRHFEKLVTRGQRGINHELKINRINREISCEIT